ncbi:MAG: glycosyltransferase family 1 protein [Bacteroidia bacterium]|nr:glycosyltransferase family 1 protein [Bacteroidia bacterium]
MYLHVVSFDIPSPPTYGGVIDVYYKLKALHALGVKIILHTFWYSRPEAPDLLEICEDVVYYPRKPILRSLPVKIPHIVKSRGIDTLLDNLTDYPYPILFEGLHTTYYLGHPALRGRLRMVRMHNIEWEYYYQLAQRESDYLRKQYFLAESRLLREYEQVLAHADRIYTISPKDTSYYQETFPQKTAYLPAFHAHTSVTSLTGQGDYCLYHGKLSVPENHEAALYLIREVFAPLGLPLIIAGAEPLPDLITAINAHENILLRPDPSVEEMDDLLRQAHIHVLPTFQATGIKLKLINSLYQGRFVLVNAPMVFRTGLEFSCSVARDTEEFRKMTRELFFTPFTEIDIAQRKASLRDTFDTRHNAGAIVSLMQAHANPHKLPGA